ncbi:hypothetical protein GCM10025881_39210 [Pseudolysinimonas kribbensis]|uniref:PAS domain-containing protein n=1 Tax=Pseudolysinimonas kribbensis TaxID=433641 RepID=A0ABQ6KFN7_9MICO|nr:hypothetical protein [Pseudolysinimonas kribbensis]GMA93189.1 hypothetical protein GCM10025881_00130 [Pseudolysinimonas kribbensis]GMA97097.1 hypothetical protein GCM10025881_39210 [Pseudolysinimonas kribbensis]
MLLPITLGFVSTTVYVAARRSRAQSVLLRQHSQLIENALERARQQQRLLDEVLNTVDFGVLAFDRNGQVTFVNRTQRRWLDEFGEPKTVFVHRVVYQADRATPIRSRTVRSPAPLRGRSSTASSSGWATPAGAAPPTQWDRGRCVTPAANTAAAWSSSRTSPGSSTPSGRGTIWWAR